MDKAVKDNQEKHIMETLKSLQFKRESEDELEWSKSDDLECLLNIELLNASD